jgi:hypothetical protein
VRACVCVPVAYLKRIVVWARWTRSVLFLFQFVHFISYVLLILFFPATFLSFNKYTNTNFMNKNLLTRVRGGNQCSPPSGRVVGVT